MSNQAKGGKRPLKNRALLPTDMEDIFNSPLSVPKALQAHLNSKEMEWRFVDYQNLVKVGGRHNRGWVAYKKAVHGGPEGIMSEEFAIGANPDGIFRSGSMVLAVRPKSVGDKHRAYNAQRAQQLLDSSSRGLKVTDYDRTPVMNSEDDND